MKATDREIVESPLYQGEDEQIAYTLTTTPWGSSPTNVSVVLKNSAGVDISATNLSGSPATAGDIITTPVVHSLVEDSRYRLEIRFTIDGNISETWTDIYGQE